MVGEHHVGRDEEFVEARVVGGSEGGADEAGAIADRVARAFVVEGLGGGGSEALESVREGVDAAVCGVGGYRHRLGGGEDGSDSGDPVVLCEEGEVVGGGVVIRADLEECGQRVELVFALEDCGVGVGRRYYVVGGGAIDRGGKAGFGRWLEGIAVGVREEVAGLEIDDATEEGGYGFVG